RLAALDRQREFPDRRLLRNLGARHRFTWQPAAAHHRQLESAGLWRQCHAPDRGACRLIMERSTRISGAAARIARRLRLVVTAMILAGSLAYGQAPQGLSPSEEAPEEFPAGPGREQTFYTCVACHNFKL